VPEDIENAGHDARYKLHFSERDKKGNELLKAEYDTDGTETERFEYAYDNNKIFKQLHYYENELAETFTYQYNEAGLLLKDTLVYNDGSDLVTLYSYDENKNLTEKKLVDTEGAVETVELYIYENNLLVEKTTHDESGGLLESYRYVYNRVGEKDLVIEAVEWNEHDQSYLRTVNSYNDAGNYSGSVSYNKDGVVVGKHTIVEDEKKRVSESLNESAKEIINRKFVYDQADNLLSEERYRNNAIIYSLHRVFSDQGLLLLQTVADGQSLFTDKYEYEFH